LSWGRRVFPGGASILIDRMAVGVQAVAAGLKDRVGSHYPKLAAAILMKTIGAGPIFRFMCGQRRHDPNARCEVTCSHAIYPNPGTGSGRL